MACKVFQQQFLAFAFDLLLAFARRPLLCSARLGAASRDTNTQTHSSGCRRAESDLGALEWRRRRRAARESRRRRRFQVDSRRPKPAMPADFVAAAAANDAGAAARRAQSNNKSTAQPRLCAVRAAAAAAAASGRAEQACYCWPATSYKLFSANTKVTLLS